LDWLLVNLNFFFINYFFLVNFLNEVFFLQFIIFYTLYLIYSTSNLFFTLFYLFMLFFYFGLVLGFYNLEIFTAFLWLTECVIVFISALFLFYLNVYGNNNKINLNIYSFKYLGIFIGFFLLTLWLIFPFNLEFFLPIDLNINYYWDDYYEALNNFLINDVFGLYTSYYVLNSFEFLMIGLLLLFASMICVNLSKFNKNLKLNNYYELLTLYDFFNDFVSFLFMRKQNLTNQTIAAVSTRIFKKKVNK